MFFKKIILFFIFTLILTFSLAGTIEAKEMILDDFKLVFKGENKLDEKAHVLMFKKDPLLGDHLKIEIKIEGNLDSKEVLFMVHGYPDNLSIWDNQVAYFKKKYLCVRLTLPGFEEEPFEAYPQYNEAQIHRILDLMVENIEDRKIIVLAHDWGALYAKHFLSVKGPLKEKISKLILLDVGEFEEGQVPFLNVKYTALLALANKLPLFLGKHLLNYTFYQVLVPEKVDKNLDASLLRKDPALSYPYWQMWKDISNGKYPEKIHPKDYQIPLLFIYGKDKEVNFHSETWLMDLKKSKSCDAIGIDGAGHWMMLSHPEKLNSLIENFII